MHARVSTFEGAPEHVEELNRYATEKVVPALKQIDGYVGVLGLADRESGKVIAVTVWESEEALRASAEAANQLRSDSAEAAGESIAAVEEYEVLFSEVQGG